MAKGKMPPQLLEYFKKKEAKKEKPWYASRWPFAHLNSADRLAIWEILHETKPRLAAVWQRAEIGK